MDLEYCPYCMSPVKPGEPCGTCKLTAGSYTPSARHLPPGTVLRDRYLVGRVLGEGGFGITYIGRDLVLGLKVAVKEYFPADRATRDASVSLEVSSYMGNSSSLYLRGKANFLREAQTMARLDRQPNIVSVKDFFETNNTAYIVMEYIDGTTFKELVDQRGGKIPAWELLHLIEPMFDALHAMHDLGLIHRDISPDNLMLEQGTVRLLDFGCARESANGDATMTIMLRHGYAPLEQYQSSSEGQGPWTDIYALSATIYYCITGRKPPQAMDRLLEDKLVPPRDLGVDLSERQEKALLKGLSIQPRIRFQSAEEFHAMLYTGLDEEEERRRKEKEEKRRREEEENRRKEKEEKRQGNRWDKLLTWLKANKKAAGIAALVAVVLLGAIAAGILRGNNADGDLPSGENKENRVENRGEDENNGVSSPESAGPAANPAYVYNWDLDRFERLLNDGSVTVIIIPEGHGLSIDRPMEITKPLQLEQSAQLHLNAEVTLSSALQIPQYSDVYNNDRLTVAGEGRIEADGYFGGDGLLRTVEGGSVHIGDTGRADFGTLWLERAGDLEADSGRINLDQSRYIVADEDALFENAVHVNTFAELENAANDRRTDAIVIDGSFAVEYWLAVNKPLLLSEEAVLTTREGENGVICGNVAVNRGRLEGELQFNNGGVYLNYGSTDILLSSFDGSCILNLGEFRFRGGMDRDSSIVNLGSMSLERGAEQDTLNIVSSCLINYGSIDLVSGSLQFGANGYFGNRGTIRVSEDAELRNSSHFVNNGRLVLEGALMNEDGMVEFTRMEDLDFQGGSVEGGMILTSEDRSLLEDTENIRAAILAVRDPEVRHADIGSAQELEAMEDTVVRSVALRWIGDGVVEGDLTLTHDLIVEGTLEVTGRLTIDGGVLYVHPSGSLTAGDLELRSGACLQHGGGLIRLNGGTLALYDSDAVIYAGIDLGGGQLALYNTRFFNSNEIWNVGGIRVDDNGEHHGSYLYSWTNMDLLEGAGITVGAGMFTSNWMEVSGEVDVSGGILSFMNGARFYNGAVITVAEGSRFSVYLNGIQLESGTRIVNDGLLVLNGWETGAFCLDGEIVNRGGGHVQLCGEPRINGVFRNEGELEINWGMLYISGEFNNQGTAYTYNHEAGFQGNWTGRDLEYR